MELEVSNRFCSASAACIFTSMKYINIIMMIAAITSPILSLTLCSDRLIEKVERATRRESAFI
jgi:hypothetical protein